MIFRGIGTIVNVIAVIIGGLLGIFLKGGLQKRYQDILNQTLGVTVMFIGVSGAMSGMLKVASDGSIETQGTMILIGSMVTGALLGEWINIEQWMEKFGEWIKKKVKVKNDPKFVDGFVFTSLVICVGAMAIVGSIQDGLANDPSMLFAKSILDLFVVLVFASIYGPGAVFSFIPIALFEGLITLFASLLTPLFTDYMVAQLSFVGSVLIFCVGINLAFGKRFKVGNMLPALIMVIPFVILLN